MRGGHFFYFVVFLARSCAAKVPNDCNVFGTINWLVVFLLLSRHESILTLSGNCFISLVSDTDAACKPTSSVLFFFSSLPMCVHAYVDRDHLQCYWMTLPAIVVRRHQVPLLTSQWCSANAVLGLGMLLLVDFRDWFMPNSTYKFSERGRFGLEHLNLWKRFLQHVKLTKFVGQFLLGKYGYWRRNASGSTRFVLCTPLAFGIRGGRQLKHPQSLNKCTWPFG